MACSRNLCKFLTGPAKDVPSCPSLYTCNGALGDGYIYANNLIHGVDIAGKQYKISLFADDLLLHITNLFIAFPSFLNELELFGTLRKFKINATKSYCLDISLRVGT